MNQGMWSRQIAIPGFGEECQKKLGKSRVAVLGLGGVGGPAALYLAAAGVGSLILVDRDIVEISNLNRQILFSASDIGRQKAAAAAERLQSLNTVLNVKTVADDLKENDLRLLEGCSFVLDCFDRNIDRLAVNRTCLHFGIPAAHGFAQDFSGEVFTVIPEKSACLACALDERFPEPDVTPVIGVTTGIVGVAMASAAILHLTRIGNPMAGNRLIYDLAFPGVTKVLINKNSRCSACGSLPD